MISAAHVMHSLRFPNSGIRAKRGGGAATHGQADCKGQPAAAKAPCRGAAGHGQNPLARATSPQGATTSRRDRPRAWLAPASVGSARGQAAGGGCPLQGSKGQPRGKGCRLQGRPLAGAVLAGAAPAQGSVARPQVPLEGSSACRWGDCPRRRRAAPSPTQGQRRRRRKGGQGEG
ncbi:hypothetical protein GW17_00018265 [Ensete ventricosum]|nr:hypothetical protein GW17_00018265 [Ensete ventricosum]RZS17178.1 hypothetical protein BHM03_00049286 [Ensete ventricosum]